MRIENRQRFLVALTVAMVALYAADKLVFEPAIGWWKSRVAAITELRRQVKEGKLMIQRETGIRSRLDQMRTNTLPNNTSLAEQQVYEAFYRWERESGADVTSIMPQWKNDSDDYLTLNCRVEVAGDLGTLTRFLYDIEKGPMALKLDSLELGTRDNNGRQFSLGLQISGLALTPKHK